MDLTKSSDDRAMSTGMLRVDRSGVREERDIVAIEEPLEIRLEWVDAGAVRQKSVSITMRTPGDDEALAAGFLVGEGILRSADEIRGFSPCGPRTGAHDGQNIIRVRIADGARISWPKLERHFYSTSSCGVCGKASLEALEVEGVAPIARGGLMIRACEVCALPEKLRASQSIFDQTGGLHAAGIFRMDECGGAHLVAIHEDVGRHNALDKVIGAQFLLGALPLSNCVLCLSGRASFELVQKAAVAGVPIIVAVGAPSSLAVQLAVRFDITLIGFTRGDRFNVYHGADRVEFGS